LTRRPDVATSLTLTGGGSYAAYEVGVMTALFAGESPATGYEPLDPDLFVGTSGGAINATTLLALEARTGGLVAAVDALRKIWIERVAEGPNVCGNGVYRIKGIPFYLFDPACLRGGLAPVVSNVTEDATALLRGASNGVVDFVDTGGSPLQSVARLINISSLVSIEPILKTLRDILPLEDFVRTRRELRVVAMDLTAGQMKLFSQDDIRRLGYLPLLASAAIPVFFPPHEIEGHVYVNGTTLAGTPLRPAFSESNTMHIIYMDPQLSAIDPSRLDDIIDAMDRVLVVNFAYMLNLDIERAREINTALDLIDDGVTGGQLIATDVHAILRSLPRIRNRIQAGKPYRPVTIHRYHPRDDLGSDLGLMNLDGQRITTIIERGYRDAVTHDCVASGCVLPRRRAGPRARPAPREAQVSLLPLQAQASR
jgi:predicted acylesterase/phospholipase RssA